MPLRHPCVIGRPVEHPHHTARPLHAKHTGRMVPGMGHSPAQQKGRVPLRHHPVFVARTAQRLRAAELGHGGSERGTMRARDQPQRHIARHPAEPGLLRGRKHRAGTVCHHTRGAARPVRDDPVIHHRIMKQPEHRLSHHCHRKDHPEQRQPLGKVPGSVHRVDDDGQRGCGDRIAQVRCGGDCLFTHHHRMWQKRLHGGGDLRLGLGIGQRHEVGRPRLGRHIGQTQPPKPRHDAVARRGADDGDQTIVLFGRKRV